MRSRRPDIEMLSEPPTLRLVQQDPASSAVVERLRLPWKIIIGRHTRGFDLHDGGGGDAGGGLTKRKARGTRSSEMTSGLLLRMDGSYRASEASREKDNLSHHIMNKYRVNEGGSSDSDRLNGLSLQLNLLLSVQIARSARSYIL